MKTMFRRFLNGDLEVSQETGSMFWLLPTRLDGESLFGDKYGWIVLGKGFKHRFSGTHVRSRSVNDALDHDPVVEFLKERVLLAVVFVLCNRLQCWPLGLVAAGFGTQTATLGSFCCVLMLEPCSSSGSEPKSVVFVYWTVVTSQHVPYILEFSSSLLVTENVAVSYMIGWAVPTLKLGSCWALKLDLKIQLFCVLRGQVTHPCTLGKVVERPTLPGACKRTWAQALATSLQFSPPELVFLAPLLTD